MTQDEVDERRKYHRDYYAKHKTELQRKALKRAYERYIAFMRPDGGTDNVKENSLTDK